MKQEANTVSGKQVGNLDAQGPKSDFGALFLLPQPSGGKWGRGHAQPGAWERIPESSDIHSLPSRLLRALVLKVGSTD